ncbi:MAG: gamma-glutamyltransferase [Acidobacteria bacterium]|nr:gamma-glutamyltransferase [Acidobacteriota bacterium]
MCEVGFENFAYEEISLEGEMSQEVQKSLEMRGHHLRRVGSVGILQGILMDPKTGTFMGAAAPRGSGQSAGW